MNVLRIIAALGLGVAALAGAAAAYTPSDDTRFGWQLREYDAPLEAPEVAFLNAAGEHEGFIQYRGKVVIATVWATWCGVCLQEMPKLDALAAKYRGRPLVVAPISIDYDGRRVTDFAQAKAMIEAYYAEKGLANLPIYVDEEMILTAVTGVRGTPTTFFIGADGRVIGEIEGSADWTSPEAERLIEHHLALAEAG